MKNVYFLFIVWISCSFQLFAQNEVKEKLDLIREDGAYFTAELLPEFPGGPEAVREYLRKNIKYPDEALAQKISGSVLIQFVIEADGSISRQKVLKSVHSSLDTEAMRVVSNMPAWTPGKQNGIAVPVIYNIPIVFNHSQSEIRNKSNGFIIPNDKSDKDPSLEGIWQLCLFANPLDDGKYRVIVAPILKIFKDNNQFTTIMLNAGDRNSFLNISGRYELTSSSTFTEYIEKSITDPQCVGEQVALSFEFLTDNLIKVTFQLSNNPSTFTEHWLRLGHEQLKNN